jgi:hypothetical protein
VTENTANILEECGIVTIYRGETFVKGAGYIKTFFVPLDENYDLVKKDVCLIKNRNRHYSARNITSSESDYGPDIPAYETRQHSANSDCVYEVASSIEEDDAEELTVVTSSHSISDDSISVFSSVRSDTSAESEAEVLDTRC